MSNYHCYEIELRRNGSVRRVSLRPDLSVNGLYWSEPDGRYGGTVVATDEGSAVAKLRKIRERFGDPPTTG